MTRCARIISQLHIGCDESNWWFVARQRILFDVMLRHIPALRHAATGFESPLNLLDIGSGGGSFVRALGRYGRAVGIDAAAEAVAASTARGLDVRLGHLPGELPLDGEAFDVVTLLDVLEHIDQEAASLAMVRDVLEPDGFLVCTVPAYDFLWSYHDVVNDHRRRYTRGRLRTVLLEAGFEIVKLSYFNSVLFPPIAIVRTFRRIASGRGNADSPVVPAPINRLLGAVFAMERWPLRWLSLPFGVSILAIARKRGDGIRVPPMLAQESGR